MNKGIIFDMDGVIIDSEPTHLKITKNIINNFGGTISDEISKKFVGTTDEYMWSEYKDFYEIDMSVEDLMTLKEDMFLSTIESIPLVSGFNELIENLYSKGFKIAIASSNNKKAVEKVIEYFGLDKYLVSYLTGDDVEEGKPSPEIFLKTSKKLNISPQNCLVIEDSNAGVKAAKAAGMYCIGYENPNSGNQDLSKSDFIVDNLCHINKKNLNFFLDK